MPSNSPISRFERFARSLIEGSFDRLVRQPGPLAEVTTALVAAAENSQRNGLAANRYLLRVHPALLDEMGESSTRVAAVMETMLARFGEENGLVFAGDLDVALEIDPSLEASRVVVVAEQDGQIDEPTAVLRRVKATASQLPDGPNAVEAGPGKGATAPLKMTEAYLILNGRRHVALDKAVNAIGRALENDIVLEDPGVSRNHAQIRWRNGRFEIFDLGSRAGTLLNGRQVASGTLRPGDVITLGAAAVIYGEEDQGSDSLAPSKRSSADVTQELSLDDLK